jgi:hypothetical protein
MLARVMHGLRKAAATDAEGRDLCCRVARAPKIAGVVGGAAKLEIHCRDNNL